MFERDFRDLLDIFYSRVNDIARAGDADPAKQHSEVLHIIEGLDRPHKIAATQHLASTVVLTSGHNSGGRGSGEVAGTFKLSTNTKHLLHWYG